MEENLQAKEVSVTSLEIENLALIQEEVQALDPEEASLKYLV